MQLSSKRRSELIAGPFTRLLGQHEECLANLYKCFAAAIPDAKEFWSKLAEEEICHKNLLDKIDERFRDRTWSFARPNFTTGAIAGSCDRIMTKCEAVAKGGISMRDAMDYALAQERSLIESDFLQIIDRDNSDAMSALETLRTQTHAHVRELEKETKRLKWKVKGNKKITEFDRSTLVRATAHENVRAAQGNVIGNMMALEEATAALYRTYASRLVEYEKFWSKIAAEEMQHAAVLRKLYAVLEKGNLFFNVARFGGEEMLKDVDFVLNLEYEGRSEDLSMHKALNHALEVENLLVEKKFYRTVKSDAPEFKFIAERMVKESMEHLKRLEDEVGKAIDMGTAVAKPAEPLIEED